MSSHLHKPGIKLGVDTYTVALVLASSLYFLRLPGLSIYIFDFVWAAGLLMFPGLFLRMPNFGYLALSAFAATLFISVIYCLVDGRPNDLLQAITILLRFFQIAICANFFYNCSRANNLNFRSLAISGLVGFMAPIVGGLALYLLVPDMATTFNRYSGYLDNPNSIGLYVAIVTPVFFAMIRLGALPRYLVLPAIAAFLILAVYSLVLAGSNSGAILFIAALFLSLMNSAKSALFSAIGVFFIYILANVFSETLFLWAYQLSASDFSGLKRTGALLLSVLYNFNPTELGSHSYRLQIQDFLFYKQFSDLITVILGLGPGQSHLLVLQAEGNSATIHNFYLRMFVEFGIVGCLAFAILIYSFFYRFSWRFLSFLIGSGLVLASLGTPALYLPFYWMPPMVGLALVTLLALSEGGAGRRRVLHGGARNPIVEAEDARDGARGLA